MTKTMLEDSPLNFLREPAELWKWLGFCGGEFDLSFAFPLPATLSRFALEVLWFIFKDGSMWRLIKSHRSWRMRYCLEHDGTCRWILRHLPNSCQSILIQIIDTSPRWWHPLVYELQAWTDILFTDCKRAPCNKLLTQKKRISCSKFLEIFRDMVVGGKVNINRV